MGAAEGFTRAVITVTWVSYPHARSVDITYTGKAQMPRLTLERSILILRGIRDDMTQKAPDPRKKPRKPDDARMFETLIDRRCIDCKRQMTLGELRDFDFCCRKCAYGRACEIRPTGTGR